MDRSSLIDNHSVHGAKRRIFFSQFDGLQPVIPAWGSQCCECGMSPCLAGQQVLQQVLASCSCPAVLASQHCLCSSQQYWHRSTACVALSRTGLCCILRCYINLLNSLGRGRLGIRQGGCREVRLHCGEAAGDDCRLACDERCRPREQCLRAGGP
jgi:hypothetical protein